MVLRCVVLPLCASAKLVYMHLANGVFQPYHSAGWLPMVSNDFPQPLAQATSWVKETGWRGDFGLNSTTYTFQSGRSTQPNAQENQIKTSSMNHIESFVDKIVFFYMQSQQIIAVWPDLSTVSGFQYWILYLTWHMFRLTRNYTPVSQGWSPERFQKHQPWSSYIAYIM